MKSKEDAWVARFGSYPSLAKIIKTGTTVSKRNQQSFEFPSNHRVKLEESFSRNQSNLENMVLILLMANVMFVFPMLSSYAAMFPDHVEQQSYLASEIYATILLDTSLSKRTRLIHADASRSGNPHTQSVSIAERRQARTGRNLFLTGGFILTRLIFSPVRLRDGLINHPLVGPSLQPDCACAFCAAMTGVCEDDDAFSHR